MKSRIKLHLLYSLIFLSYALTYEGDTYDFFLPNGLKVILMEKHSAPKVAVSIFYNVGSHDEPDGQKGINELISTAILQGTEKYPSEFRQKKER